MRDADDERYSPPDDGMCIVGCGCSVIIVLGFAGLILLLKFLIGN